MLQAVGQPSTLKGCSRSGTARLTGNARTVAPAGAAFEGLLRGQRARLVGDLDAQPPDAVDLEGLLRGQQAGSRATSTPKCHRRKTSRGYYAGGSREC